MPDPAGQTGFHELFGVRPAGAAEAPGRVNLIGEHTDYHEGYVLPAVIPQCTRAEVAPRPDTRVRAWSRGISDHIVEYVLGTETAGRGWLDYVQGITAELTRDGRPLTGFDLRLESTVPLGAGVSSSAALEVSVLRALRQVFELTLDDLAVARVAHRVETEFVGAPVGIMDQMASSLGRLGEALFLDTRTLRIERIPLPESADLVAIDSGITHQHAGGAYATRRKESFDAAAQLRVSRLRDVGIEALPRLAALPPLLARRARHIITENQRVLDAVVALRAGDAARLGELFNASHASMRDDYETSTSEIDTLVSVGQTDPDVYGARLTGGGFGGAVVMLAQRGRGGAVAARIVEKYDTLTGRRATTLLPPP